MTDDKPTYIVQWSDEDDGWLATTSEYPSLSWIATTPVYALRGLIRTVGEVKSETFEADPG